MKTLPLPITNPAPAISIVFQPIHALAALPLDLAVPNVSHRPGAATGAVACDGSWIGR
jgi:hypothetical protein